MWRDNNKHQKILFMADKVKRFWESKPLHDFSQQEWESLCDGCGLCCLQKLQDEDSEEVVYTAVSCQYLDTQACRCKVYERRFEYLPECLNLTKANLAETLPWLPSSCSYKLVHEGKKLPDWHHLNSHDSETIHRYNHSVRDKVISELEVNEEDWEDYIIHIS